MSTESRARMVPDAFAGMQRLATPLVALLAAGFVLRVLLIGASGFHNDVQAFESWTGTLRDNPPWQFYPKAGFADYPPGYFVVLWFVGKLYALLPGTASDAANGLPVLRALVKLPAIAMDLVDAGVIYLIVRRYAAERVAVFAAALMALNPAAIYVSAYWGQVDSVAWGLVLVALWCMLRAGDDPAKLMPRLVWAWLAFAFAILIKPQPATIGFLLLAYPFATADAALRARRLAATGAGIGAAVAFGLAVALTFHPAADVVGWLLARYEFGSGVYAYNTVNAFNLYAVRQPFWQPDDVPLSVFGVHAGSLAQWGIVLVLAASALIVTRYVQRKSDRALLEGALLCALAFFVLATRMHERYVYGAFLLAMPLLAFGRANVWPALVLTVTMYLNLAYSLAYQTVMEAHTPGVNATDLWPAISHPAALANVLVFFVLGFVYLGGGEHVQTVEVAGAVRAWSRRVLAPLEPARAWFDPREGLAAMTRLDVALMFGFVVVAFVIAVINLGWPPEKIFDEVYFPRGGAEYLRGVPQYEWTHPPLTKLFIAVSIALFGGIHGGGDTSLGWRFLNVVAGAVEVGVVYAFAKRLCGSTLFAAVAATLLTFDGFHFAEQRIATGEILIATLIVIVLYALYRYWLAAQVRAVPWRPKAFGGYFALTMGLGIPLAVFVSWLVNRTPPNDTGMIANGIYPATGADAVTFSNNAHVVAFLYVMLGVYLFARLVVARAVPPAGRRASYADGTRVDMPSGRAPIVVEPAGAAPASGTRAPNARAAKQGAPPARAAAGSNAGQLRVEYLRDGSERYATPGAEAAFSPDGTMRVGTGSRSLDGRSANFWLIVLAVALGLLVSSKWNGLFDYALAFVVIAAVAAQRFLNGRALYGNPFGFPLDVTFATLLFVPATIYALSYLPTFVLGNGHNLTDLFALQYQMYYYHSHSVSAATHPYSSVWWQWPIMQIPIVYYYKDFRAVADQANAAACCVAEIMALPNPAVFLLGLISVPFTAWLAWRERNKGYALLALAYFMQWLPWVHSPRLMFEYHFFPNLAPIVLCDVVLIQRLFQRGVRRGELEKSRWYLGIYLAAVVVLFVYFYPILAGMKLPWDAWHMRMWPDVWHIPGTSWILPHPNG